MTSKQLQENSSGEALEARKHSSLASARGSQAETSKHTCRALVTAVRAANDQGIVAHSFMTSRGMCSLSSPKAVRVFVLVSTFLKLQTERQKWVWRKAVASKDKGERCLVIRAVF